MSGGQPSTGDLDPTLEGRFGPFAFPDFRLLWLTGLSWTATRELRLLVSGFWLLEETGSAAQLGLLGAVQLVVQIPAVLWAGALADRIDRRRLLVVTQLSVASMVALLGVLSLAGQLQPWHIYAGTAVMGATTVMGQPARGALLASVVPERQLVKAVTAQAITMNVSAVIAPLTFAVVVESIDVTAAFFLTAAVAAPGALVPLLIQIRFQPPLVSDGSSTVQRTREGLSFVRRHPILPGLYLLDGGITVFSFYRQLFPLFASELYGGGAAAVGLLGTASSIGSIVGTALVLLLQRVRAHGRLVLYATLVYAALLFPLAVAPDLWMGMVLIGGLGLSDGISVAVRQSIVQLTTPDAMRGRALSLEGLAAQSANNIGTLEVGLMSAAIGLSGTLIFGGAASALITLWIWRAVPGIRRYQYGEGTAILPDDLASEISAPDTRGDEP